MLSDTKLLFVLDYFDTCNHIKRVFAPEIDFEILMYQHVAHAAATAYLERSEEYTDPQIIGQYDQYISRQKKKLLPHVFKNDLAAAIVHYENLGKITKKI